jgi:hypothetical protein
LYLQLLLREHKKALQDGSLYTLCPRKEEREQLAAQAQLLGDMLEEDMILDDSDPNHIIKKYDDIMQVNQFWACESMPFPDHDDDALALDAQSPAGR